MGVADSSPPFIASPLDESEIEGPLDKSSIQATIRRHVAEVRRCYDAGLRRNSDLEGTVVVAFTITPEGHAKLAAVAESSLGDLLVERCLTETVERMRFPRNGGSGDVKVSYPFVLVPQGAR